MTNILWELFNKLIKEFTTSPFIFLLIFFTILSQLVKVTALKEGKKLVGIAVMIFLHFIFTIFSILSEVLDIQIYDELSTISLIFAELALIKMATILIFKIIFPKIKIETPLILQDLIFAGTSLILFFVTLSRFGYNISGLIATSAVVTAVIGFSLQDTLVNIMGGLSVQLENSINEGDWIKVGDLPSGKVKELRWRYTSIETRNWETIVIPNSIIAKNNIVILGKRENEDRKWRRWVYFNVDFRFNPNDVISIVTETLTNAKIANVASDPPINCILFDMTDSYCKYALRYWLTDFSVDDPTDSEIRTWIYFALKRACIPLSIPANTIFLTENSPEREERKQNQELKIRMALLKGLDLFSHLPENELERVAHHLTHAPFKKGEIITRQNSEPHWLYILTKGNVSVNVESIEGNSVIANIQAPSFFGEISLMTGTKRSATIISETDTECYKLDKSVFQQILKERPEVSEILAEVLAKRKANLDKVKENLDSKKHQEKIETHKTDLLYKMKLFFGINDNI